MKQQIIEIAHAEMAKRLKEKYPSLTEEECNDIVKLTFAGFTSMAFMISVLGGNSDGE